MADTSDSPVVLGEVLKKEQEQIKVVRQMRFERSRKGLPRTPGDQFNQGCPRTPAVAPAAPTPGRVPTEADRPEWQTEDADWVQVIKSAHEANLVGLAFSGGGIRSATFNLGVLQALADLKLLYRVDYLSTVSGGGYIGAWLVAWTKRLRSFAKAQQQLSTHRVHLKDDKEPPPVRFLRVFSNYLTPELGFFNGDTWAMIAIYLRNLLLNQAVVLALVATVLLLPRVVKLGTSAAISMHGIEIALMGVDVVLLLFAFLMILIYMGYLDSQKIKGVPQLTEQKWVLLLVSLPLFIAAVLAALCPAVIFGWKIDYHPFPFEKVAFWLGNHQLFPYENALLIGAFCYCLILGLANWAERVCGKQIAGSVARMLSWIIDPGNALQQEKESEQASKAADEKGTAKQSFQPAHDPGEQPIKTGKERRREILRKCLEAFIKVGAALCAGALAGLLYALLSGQALFQDMTMAPTLMVGVPLVVGILLLTGVLHIGLMGVVFRDWKREWWGRLGGWLLLFAILWLTLFWLALGFPDFIRSHTVLLSGWKAWALKSLTPAWILSTIGTVLAGNSKSTGKSGSTTWVDLAAKVGPYVFIAGLLCWTSWGIDFYLKGSGTSYTSRLFMALLACIVVTVILSLRVDINQFSMHLFYRNRLVGCYLGASHKKRSPNRFTGFDPDDDLPLKDLGWKGPGHCVFYDGPYPVMNASLNLVKGKDLAWQERKAESFVMTPHYCGYDVWLEEQDSPMLTGDIPQTNDEKKKPGDVQPPGVIPGRSQNLERFGYRPTSEYAFPAPFHGPNLGLAMAISGAAASPNMGFHSSTPVAFLMTVFNVRLGQWLGNPRNKRTSKRSTPIFGLGCLVNELLGGTNDEAPYVYLSDGGHFENLGLYELVKRRCGLIIVCDAEEDVNFGFSGLGNAIRKCRIDLGIDIDLDISEIAPKKAGGSSKKHCAIGKVHYEYADRDAPTGMIIYFKASLTGNEPVDVRNYKSDHASFPHESTADQWFSESQFESYRQLGYHEVSSSIQGALPDGPQPLDQQLRTIFQNFGFEIAGPRPGVVFV